MLEHIFEGGSDSEGESIEEKTDREDEEFLFDDILQDRMKSFSSGNTEPAPGPGPAQALALGASIVASADIYQYFF